MAMDIQILDILENTPLAQMTSLEKDLLVVVTSWIAQDMTCYVLSSRFKLMMRSIQMLQDTGRWTGMYRDEFTRVVTGIDMKRFH